MPLDGEVEADRAGCQIPEHWVDKDHVLEVLSQILVIQGRLPYLGVVLEVLLLVVHKEHVSILFDDLPQLPAELGQRLSFL